MPTGPFDRRTRRSRCAHCARSHSKCSGEPPCIRCIKHNFACNFPASQFSKTSLKIISLDQGKHLTIVTFPKASSPSPPLPDPTAHAFSFFHNFILRNSFTGHAPAAFLPEIQCFLKEPNSPLLHAIQAIGAVQTRRNCRGAFEAYARAIASLRHILSQLSPPPITTVLWTTFFLGLFELMTDASGAGWVQHMVHGTARALIASGPNACLSGGTRVFFLQARPFEVCKAVIFNEISFLGEPEWRKLERETEVGHEEEVFGLIVLCSNLRVRTASFIDDLSEPPTPFDLITALSLAKEGFRLRAALIQLQTPSLLSTILHAATSIYLSGNYDYDLSHWRSMQIAVPILDSQAVTAHWQTIIRTAEEVLRERKLSPLLLLYPLRVAGARAQTLQEQMLVDKLLTDVGREFVVAEAFLAELRKIWRQRNKSLAGETMLWH